MIGFFCFVGAEPKLGLQATQIGKHSAFSQLQLKQALASTDERVRLEAADVCSQMTCT